MIVKIIGKLVEKKDQSLIINMHGLFYEILVPSSVLNRIDQTKDADGNVHLFIYHYFQIGPGSGQPILIGFLNTIERDFFLEFIKVSGIGPRAAIKALNKPISEISKAIGQDDLNYLTGLPGIGLQRAKEIVAKLQGKIGKFALIRDRQENTAAQEPKSRWQEEALEVLLQLQYKRQEALEMIDHAFKRAQNINSAEALLNEIYRQKVRG